MRWQEESSRPIISDCANSMEIIADAYYEGHINWNVYQKAREKIGSNMNGGWMFESGNAETASYPALPLRSPSNSTS